MSFDCTIHMAPKAKPRPRSSIPWTWVFSWIRKGKTGRRPTPHIHSDPKYGKWEDHLAAELSSLWSASEHKGKTLDEACRLRLLFFFPRPKAKTWKTRPNLRYVHTSRPDSDNCAKAVKDAMQKAGILQDDSIVWDLQATKYVCSGEELPRIEVGLKWGLGHTKPAVQEG